MENKVLPLTCLDLANFDLLQSAVSLKQEEVFEQSKKFFDLPLEDKMKALRNETHRGYSPALEQNQIHGDYNKESFFMGTEGLKDDPLKAKPFYRPNIWPDSDVLPGWRMTMENYHQELLRVCKAIARILALALDLDADYFNTSEMLENPIAYMRLLHYEGGMSDSSRGIYGCGAHTDHGMMTLLATDGVMGLQICKDKDMKPQKWEYVPSIDGAYIVNLGDVLERWSNGLFKSTMHRVLANGQDRYSANSILLESKSRLSNRMSSYMPVRKQSSQISSDHMFSVSHPAIQRIPQGNESISGK
ncbi:hypothetical protein Bca4012_008108 [Brassica carinata]